MIKVEGKEIAAYRKELENRKAICRYGNAKF